MAKSSTPALPAITIQPQHCLRCGYRWYPRTSRGEKPKRCASCRSPYWNKPYQGKETDARRKKRKVKPQRKAKATRKKH